MALSVPHDNFASERQISIEPSSPETTSISRHVDLVQALRNTLASGSNLEARAIGVAAYNLEVIDGPSATLRAGKESAKSSVVASEVVAFTGLQVPRLGLFDQIEASVRKHSLRIVHCVEVAG